MNENNISNLLLSALKEMGEDCISLQVLSSTEVQDATFVVAKMEFSTENREDIIPSFTLPFIIYEDGGIFMARDWQGWTPTESKDIPKIEWISMPEMQRTIMFNGLPRIL